LHMRSKYVTQCFRCNCQWTVLVTKKSCLSFLPGCFWHEVVAKGWKEDTRSEWKHECCTIVAHWHIPSRFGFFWFGSVYYLLISARGANIFKNTKDTQISGTSSPGA